MAAQSTALGCYGRGMEGVSAGPRVPAQGGWAWLMRLVPQTEVTHLMECWDGLFGAACPACGEDCLWDAWSSNPLCRCCC